MSTYNVLIENCSKLPCVNCEVMYNSLNQPISNYYNLHCNLILNKLILFINNFFVTAIETDYFFKLLFCNLKF